MNAFYDTLIAFKLVWLRVACYFIIPFVTTFLGLTETWSGQNWDDSGAFLKARLFLSCFISGITSFVAYIDSSFQRATQKSNELKEERKAEET